VLFLPTAFAQSIVLVCFSVPSALYCPDCFSSNVAQQSGCTGVTCFDCGHSECS
jgi:hypothetical protein